MQDGPEFFVVAQLAPVQFLAVAGIIDLIGDEIPFPGDDARCLLCLLHARFVRHDLGGIAPAQVGHGQLGMAAQAEVLDGLVAIAQPHPVHVEEGGQLAQVRVINLAATRPLVHGRTRDADHVGDLLQAEFLVLEKHFQTERERILGHPFPSITVGARLDGNGGMRPAVDQAGRMPPNDGQGRHCRSGGAPQVSRSCPFLVVV